MFFPKKQGKEDLGERKMLTNFFCTNFLKTPRAPRHPGKIPGTSQIPLFETQGRQTFEREHELFDHHPFTWKTPTPPGGHRTQKANLCAPFSSLTNGRRTVIQIGGVYTTLCQEGGILLQKYRGRNGRYIAILFGRYQGQGSLRFS